MSLTQDDQAVHLPVVNVTCAAGHRTGTRKASGGMMRCPRCWHDNGTEVMVRVPSRGAPEPPPAAEVIYCKGCGGTAERREDGRGPAGWYALSVTVPEALSSRKPFIWLGTYCSVACLAASEPDLRRQEELAHQAYDPVRPQPRRVP